MELKSLIEPNNSKILLLVADGLGGIPHPEYGYKTELEAARTPNLDNLASKSALGLTIPVAQGITPGSGPAHLSLFGYDPQKYEIGRGVLEALGIGFHMTKRDVAARGNFATIQPDRTIIDRRAGRIPTEESRKIVEKLQEHIKEIDGVEIILKPGKEHRFVLVLRGDNLSDKISDTDPQHEGLKILDPSPLSKEAEFTAQVVKKFVDRAIEILKDEPKANGILLRGFAKVPDLEPFPEKYRLRALSIAAYPMYKGLTRLLGFDTPDAGDTFELEVEKLKELWHDYDFIYLHYKDTDKAGEDGDFEKKVHVIEKLDTFIPELLNLKPEVFIVTGDHSTPSLIGGHSWHPNPLLIYSEKAGIFNADAKFTERDCSRGYLGTINSIDLMPLLLAMSGRLKKFGA